jgi:hypothetical protein
VKWTPHDFVGAGADQHVDHTSDFGHIANPDRDAVAGTEADHARTFGGFGRCCILRLQRQP